MCKAYNYTHLYSQGHVVVCPVHHGMLCVQGCTDNDINTDSTDHYMYYRDKGRIRGVTGGRWGGLYARGILLSSLLSTINKIIIIFKHTASINRLFFLIQRHHLMQDNVAIPKMIILSHNSPY